jgi:long-chain acyl-CoA synthetase
MNLAKYLLRTTLANPTSPAIFHGEQLFCNYQNLSLKVGQLAHHFIKQWGLKHQDRIALCVKNCPEYIPVLYACWWAGLVVVPINAKLHAQEVKYIIENSKCSAAFLDIDFLETLQQEWALSHSTLFLDGKTLTPASLELNMAADMPTLAIQEVASNDLAWIFYTSGTTGKPKGVMLSHGNIQAMTSCYFSDVDPVEPTNTSVYAAPMSHGAGFYILPHILRGAKHLIPKSGGFDPEELLQLASYHRELSMFAAPTMIKRLVDFVKDLKEKPVEALDGIKTIVYGGGPMYVQDLQSALEVMGNKFVQIYGQGESPMAITSLRREYIDHKENPHWLNRISSVGLPQSLVEVKVVDSEGSPLPIGEAGEIIVKGPTVMSGYWNNPEATASALKDQWLWTGDMGAFDAEGFLTLKDRSKDLIISGGSNIYPREVEEVLLEHLEISEVSVIGSEDAEWGEIVIAVVTLQNRDNILNTSLLNELEKQLDELCLQKIARFKRPKAYLWLHELPKNNYGKILKTTLREIWQARKT